MNQIIEMNVSTPEQFFKAVSLFQNLFAEESVINVLNKKEEFSESEKLIDDIRLGVKTLYKNTTGSFAMAQLSQYSFRMNYDPFGNYSKLIVNTKYFSKSKEINDLICVAAEIAELLNKKVKNQLDTFEKVDLFDGWVKRNFKYKNTHQIEDHTAIDLLRKRSGVCQAIAAIAVLVLSFMGVKIIYVAGEGKGTGGWGRHAWNAVKINNRWVHVDFTFSMNSFKLPSTKSYIEKRCFDNNHRWNEKEFNNQSMDFKWENTNWWSKDKMTIDIMSYNCNINGVDVRFKSPLLIFPQNKSLVDVVSVVRLLGGGIELIPQTEQINICVCNKRYVLKDAFKYYHDGYFDKCILDHIWENVWIDKTRLRIAI